MEVFPSRDGLLCWMEESKQLLEAVLPAGSEAWAIPEGNSTEKSEAALRISAPYQSFCIHETAILGILAQKSG